MDNPGHLLLHAWHITCIFINLIIAFDNFYSLSVLATFTKILSFTFCLCVYYGEPFVSQLFQEYCKSIWNPCSMSTVSFMLYFYNITRPHPKTKTLNVSIVPRHQPVHVEKSIWYTLSIFLASDALARRNFRWLIKLSLSYLTSLACICYKTTGVCFNCYDYWGTCFIFSMLGYLESKVYQVQAV